MTTTCKKCGAPASEDQAFCAKCGAVIGMEAPKKADTPPNLARTVVVKDLKLPPLPKKSAAQHPAPKRDVARGDASQDRGTTQGAAPPGPRTSEKVPGNSALLVVAGFLAVLLVGGLLLLLLYFFLQG